MKSKTAVPDILIVTVNRIETQAVLDAFPLASEGTAELFTENGLTYHQLGAVNGYTSVMTQSEMGSGSLGASQQTISYAIAGLRPSVVILVGVAFGMKPGKQEIGTILVSKQVSIYEPQRIGSLEGTQHSIGRGSRVDASPQLLNRLRAVDSRRRDGATAFRFIGESGVGRAN